MRKLAFGLIIGAALLLGSNSAQADSVTTYTSLSAWQAAAGSPTTTEDFADTTLATGLSISFASGNISGGLFNGFGPCIECPGTGSVFTFTPGTSAFGGDFDLTPGGNGGGLDLLIGFSNATTTDVFIAGADPEFNGFFGVTSNGASITSVTLKGADLFGNGETFTLDNLQFRSNGGGGGTTPVPEPSTALLFGSALVGLLRLVKSRLA
jgi:PEP-CTERM motif